jgi:hypothetical protein
MNTRRFPALAVLAAAVLAACEQPVTPAGPTAEPPRSPELTWQGETGIDGEFLRVQRRVPGFAGYYFDQNGDLTVLLTDVGQEGPARELLAGVAEERPGGPVPRRAAAIRVRRAEFDFATLNAWHRKLGPVLSIEGVEFLDTDEVANRVTVGVVTDAAAQQVLGEAARLGVPRGAVVVERVGRGGPIATLRDRIRPVPGGLEVWNTATYPVYCTLGFNVWYSNYKLGIPTGTRAFLTASHCTATTFGYDGTRFTQGGTRIGRELVDPPLFDATTTTRCPAGRRCRWSDVAVVQYDDSVAWDLGYIAKPQWSVSNPSTDYTIQIDPYNPRLTVAGNSYPTVGAYVNKIGRTTGWTWGPVLRTCVDYPWSESSGAPIILCQTEVDATALDGDSGSPAFIYNPENNAYVAGIVWRKARDQSGNFRRFVFSPRDQIRNDIVTYSPF